MNFYTLCKFAAQINSFENAKCTPQSQPRRRQAGPTGQQPTRPGQGKARGLDPPRGAATTRRGAASARTRAATAAAARAGAARQGRSRPGEMRTGMRRRRRASPAVAQARSGGEGAVRRAGAAAGGEERLRPCREADGAGLDGEWVEEG